MTDDATYRGSPIVTCLDHQRCKGMPVETTILTDRIGLLCCQLCCRFETNHLCEDPGQRLICHLEKKNYLLDVVLFVLATVSFDSVLGWLTGW
jgi:hypothetical protein